ncbi:acyl-coenzyme A thioesterase 1-like [Oratosquilla oratoria]|uniref:acyl-coenzyme A thioesterase 1-like n=1 Tax=Oratosquilla oratoria TaxID=337810 RepID=UPI003F7716A7
MTICVFRDQLFLRAMFGLYLNGGGLRDLGFFWVLGSGSAAMAPGVRRIVVQGEMIRGTLFLPARPGSHPSILDMYGTTVGFLDQRSALLVSHGFASFVLEFLKYKDLTGKLTSVPLEYFEEALDYVQGHEECQKGSMGVLGSCNSSEMAIMLATMSNQSSCVYQRKQRSKEHFLFTYKGKQVFSIIEPEKKGIHQFDLPASSHTPNHPKSLPIEKVPDDCDVLLITGYRDSGFACRANLDLLERVWVHGKDNVHILTLPVDGHKLEMPYFNHNPILPIKIPNVDAHLRYFPLFSMCGDDLNTTTAVEISWQSIQNLFEKKLIHEPKWFYIIKDKSTVIIRVDKHEFYEFYKFVSIKYNNCSSKKS